MVVAGLTRATDRTKGKGTGMKPLLIVALLALAGCNTIAGIGEDISAGARSLQRY